MDETHTGRVGLPAMLAPGTYRLLVAGRLGADWKDRFEGTQVHLQASGDPRGLTELTVPVSDQAALLGVLGQLSEMQCVLLSVELMSEGPRLDNLPQTRRSKGD